MLRRNAGSGGFVPRTEGKQEADTNVAARYNAVVTTFGLAVGLFCHRARTISVDDFGASRAELSEVVLHFLQPFRRVPLPSGDFSNHA